MQRLPARTTTMPVSGRAVSRESEPGARAQNSSQQVKTSPLKQLALRIRDEQGIEQLKAFLLAMRPFAAPNELKNIAAEHGIALEVISAACEAEHAAERRRPEADADRPSSPSAQQNSNNMQSQLQMLQKLMYLQSILNGGGDPSALFGGLGKAR